MLGEKKEAVHHISFKLDFYQRDVGDIEITSNSDAAAFERYRFHPGRKSRRV